VGEKSHQKGFLLNPGDFAGHDASQRVTDRYVAA